VVLVPALEATRKDAGGVARPRPATRAPLAIGLGHEGVPLNVIQRQLGHNNLLGVTSMYLQGIENAEITATVHARNE
jgi:hypothetical protein